MPPSCNLFESIFFSPTGFRIPIVDTESPLHNRTGRTLLLDGSFPSTSVSKIPVVDAEFFPDNVAFQDSFKVCLHPSSTATSYVETSSS